MDSQVLKAVLITKGRRSGREHAVWLRAVEYEGKMYFSRRTQNADWMKNAMVHSTVKVVIDDKTKVGTARFVEDDVLSKKISELKYPGEERAQETRFVLQVSFD